MPYDLCRKVTENMSRVPVSKEDSIQILIGSLIADGQVLLADEIRRLVQPPACRLILHEEARLQGRSQEQVVEEILDAVPVPAAAT